MLGSDYIDIRKAVEAIDYNNDGTLFHHTVDRLALMLGFTKKKEWYEAEAVTPDYFPDRVFNFTDFANLEACIRHGMIFKYFEHNNQYEKEGDSFRASTLHEDQMSLVLKKFQLCTVTSESTLGLKYEVIAHKEFGLRSPKEDPMIYLMRAFDKGCLIRSGNSYLMSPRYLLRLAEQQGVFR
jgi:hypothetical protein